MKNLTVARALRLALPLAAAFALSSTALGFVENPDFTSPGVINAIIADNSYSYPLYSETYNLGATGLRGWIYIDHPNEDAGHYGLLTTPSRQILVTVAEAPGSAVLQVNDVILGATAETTGAVPLFTSDCRKAFGTAIAAAEIPLENGFPRKLRIKRFRNGITSDVEFPMASKGAYSATAPYLCPKSDAIFAAARDKLVAQLLANPNFLRRGGYDLTSAISGLALLASVAPGHPNYSTVQGKLKSYATALAGMNLQSDGRELWHWSYMGIFLSEYYSRTVADSLLPGGTPPDAAILAGVNRFTVAMAKAQSRYGTFSHGNQALQPDGSLHGTVKAYGPVNAVGLPVNLAIMTGKKALLAGNYAIDPEINDAIERASKFFGYYVNKGSIPYGEHVPWVAGHSSNGKDPMCAVFYGLQDNRPVEAEYFARMSVAGCTGREFGHDGQGFSYIWGALGVNMGGPLATAKYMENYRWHSDLARRTDGSFCYDGNNEFGTSSTSDNTYLGPSAYTGINSTAIHLLSYSLPLKRLMITGRNLSAVNALSVAKVNNAIAAATYKQDCVTHTIPQLFAGIVDYDPIVRYGAARQLASRNLNVTEINLLINMLSDMTNANARMGACSTLGYLNDQEEPLTHVPLRSTAIPILGQLLSDPDLWVRACAATAIRHYKFDDAKLQRDVMLTAFVANATDPEVIVWNDPLQIANRHLSSALFGDAVGTDHPNRSIARSTKDAPKNLLHPAVRKGLKQPDSYPRFGVAAFVNNRLTFEDIKELALDIIQVVSTRSEADTMWYYSSRLEGLATLLKHNSAEAIPMALKLLEVSPGWTWDSSIFMPPAMDALIEHGDLARYAIPELEKDIVDVQNIMHPTDVARLVAPMQAMVLSIKNATAPKTGLIHLLPLATSKVVATTGPRLITLTGTSPRSGLTFTTTTVPSHGTLTGTGADLTYTPTPGYVGLDQFTFKATDSLTSSLPGTISIIVGTAGSGLVGEYYDNTNFTSLKHTRVDPQINFAWAAASPAPTVSAGSYSIRWRGQLLVPETGNYKFSALNSDGVRLSINGRLIINSFIDQALSWHDSSAINLTAGQKVEVIMEHYENTPTGMVKLKWTGPSFTGLNGSIIGKEWLYDNTPTINSPPVAEAQNLNIFKNTSQLLTLSGSSAGAIPLTYSITAPPAHGTLVGAAQTYTYTPASNYVGADSFTFTVTNSSGASDTATVSINVSATQLTAYYWAQAINGDWNGPNWSSATGASITPPAAGSASCSLNFNQPGTYTTLHNLNDTMNFNQLNLAAAVTISGTNRLSPMAAGAILPQIHQNGSGLVSISAPLNLTGMTTLGGTGSGQVDLTNSLTGAGGFILNGTTTFKLFGLPTNPPNTYPGGTTINSGVLHLGGDPAGDSPTCLNPAGTGVITLNSGGTLEFDRVTLSNNLAINGGRMISLNGYGASFSGAITLNSNVSSENEAGSLTCTGNISGVGGFTKTGARSLRLTGNNSFTGPISVQAGFLRCNTPTSIGVGPLDITTGAIVDLNYTGTRIISSLTYNGGGALPPGIYGSTDSPAAFTSANFIGMGTLTILPASDVNLTLATGTNPSYSGAPLTYRAVVSGTNLSGSVEFYNGATLLGSGSLDANNRATYSTTTLPAGLHPISARYLGNANSSTSTSPVLAQVIRLSTYQAWANSGAMQLTLGVNDGPTADPDKDGMTNLAEFVLGGSPMKASLSAMPKLSKTTTGWTFEYNRSHLALWANTKLVVEYGNGLSAWTSIEIPAAGNANVTITPYEFHDLISVRIPGSGVKNFARLKVTK